MATSTSECADPQTLKPSDPTPQSDGHDPLPDHHTHSQPSDAAPGEKRRRDGEEPEPDEPHPMWKTSLCSFFRRHPGGSCSHGATCRYAHGEAELRPRPDNTWDPTSDRAKKLARISDHADDDDQVMMTEAVVDAGVDDDGDGENGVASDSGLAKCLVHLPRKWRSENLNGFLSEQGISYQSAKKKKGMTVGFVTFESSEQLTTAMEELKGKSIGNKSIKVADVVPRSFEKNVKPTMGVSAASGGDGDASVPSNGTQDVDGNEVNGNLNGSATNGRSARDVVTPLAHMSYSDQLEHKKSSISQILKRLTRNARKACPSGVSLPEWILKSREIGGLPCNLEGILASPLVNGYRNKCEFSVGYSLQGKITVGFMLGNFREGVTAVEEPVDCPNVSSIACKYASIFQEFLQQSGLPVWNRFKNIGFWRQLTVREGRKPEMAVDSENSEASVAEVMLMVQVATSGFDDALVTSEFEKLAQAFVAGAATSSPSLPLTGLVVQDHKGVSNVSPADAPLRQLSIHKVACSLETEADKNPVEARIHDYISNLKFCISPTAFFQVNTLAAEKLYSLAGDWAGLGPDTLLFDVCCGTGTIGLTLAHRVGMVVGIEMNASAVADAQRNAEINGIENCRFICSKAEDVMGSLLKEYMNASQQQDEVQNVSENGDKEPSTSEEKDNSVENIQDPEGMNIQENGDKVTFFAEEKDNSVKNTQEPEGSSCQSACNVAEHTTNSTQEVENAHCAQEPNGQVQNNISSESCSPSMQRFKNIVAIVDPPRSGLHPTVIKALRTHPLLRRLVYISCNPESLVANAIELCTPSPEKIEKNKNNRGWRNMSAAGLARHRAKSMPVSEPFHPVKAMVVDLFPHTTHCEMVMLLER